MKSISFFVSLFCSLLLGGCATTPVTPASQLTINYTQMSQDDAKKLYRQKLIDAMITTEVSSLIIGPTGEGELSRMLEERDFKGAKSSGNGNDVAFIFGESTQLGGVRESIVMTDIGEGADIELYYVAPYVTGMANYQHPEKYALLITNSTICRGLNIFEPQYVNGDWSFKSDKNFSNVGCYGGRKGGIKKTIGVLYYQQLISGKPNYSYQDTAVLEGSRQQLEELASIIKAAFSNAN